MSGRCNWQFVNTFEAGVLYRFHPLKASPCKSYASKAAQNMKTFRLFLLSTHTIHNLYTNLLIQSSEFCTRLWNKVAAKGLLGPTSSSSRRKGRRKGRSKERRERVNSAGINMYGANIPNMAACLRHYIKRTTLMSSLCLDTPLYTVLYTVHRSHCTPALATLDWTRKSFP